MKIGLVCNPENVKWPWIQQAAIERGHDCKWVLAKDIASADCKWADAILFAQYGYGSGLGLPSQHRVPWGCWIFDTLLLHGGVSLNQQPGLVTRSDNNQWMITPWLRYLRQMDIVFSKERGIFPEMRQMGIKPAYLDQGAPSSLGEVAHAEKPEFDVVFFGNTEQAWHQRRLDIAALCESGLRVAVAGRSGDAIPRCATALPYCQPLDLPALASRAAVVLVVSFHHAVEGYWSDRLWLSLGMGAACMVRDVPGLPMTGGIRPFVKYKDTAELVAETKLLVADYERRKSMGKAAREWVMREHTYGNRIDQLVEIVAAHPKSAKASPADKQYALVNDVATGGAFAVRG